MSNETQQQPKEQGQEENKKQTQSNLDEIEQELETSSQYFKPKSPKSYIISLYQLY